MPRLIESLSFENAETSATYDFVPNDLCRVTAFHGTTPIRSQRRGRMGNHGQHPTMTLHDALVITHEGLIKGADGEAILAERAALIAAVLGDLTTPPTVRKAGTLTIQLHGWGGPATADVGIESWEAPLDTTVVRTAPYRFTWLAFSPMLDMSGTPVVL